LYLPHLLPPVQNKLRIIGGQWRSRCIYFPDAPGLRPTPGRVRETLFNWLQYDIVGSHCLDLYAGSGALGLEAASRGAAKVVQVESHSSVCHALRHNISVLAADKVQLVQQDVLVFLTTKSHQTFNIVFLDPPFSHGLVIQTCRLLENNHWLQPFAKVYIETERTLRLSGLPNNWRSLKYKTAGEVAYYLLERLPPASEPHLQP
jgi:16S rRNA (guanine966-N2)-methyltransferase